MNLKLGRGRRFADGNRIVSAMMLDIRERGCDRIVFSGDATTMGFESEFIAAATALQLDLPGIAVPGNHDYYVRSTVAAGLFETYFSPWQQGERLSTEVYPFAQRVGHCWLIGVNSAQSNFLLWDARGSVGREQAERLRELLRSLSPGPRILVTHYPLYLANGRPEDRWRLMSDWQVLQKIAAEEGISLWLHGHRHRGYVLESTPPERPFPLICVGSVTQIRRWSYNQYSIDGWQLTMQRRVWNPLENRFTDGERRELTLAER